MRQWRRVVVLMLVLAGASAAQVAHPRIWLDAPTLARLKALVTANDPTWTALKARADALATMTVPTYDRTACGANQICYTYEGSGYYDALASLAMAYQMTGNVAYASKVKEIFAVMEAAGSAPQAVDSGYPSRFLVAAMGLAYDWIYDQLSADDKAALANLLGLYWTQLNANGYMWVNGANGYGNYLGGHVLGFGLAAIAMEGDTPLAPTIQNAVLAKVQTYVIPAFESGIFQGGFPIEGYNYGPNNMVRLFLYFAAMNSAGKGSVVRGANQVFDFTGYAKAAAHNAVYALRPNRWRVVEEGDFPGGVAGVAPRGYYPYLGYLLGDNAEGRWMRYIANTLGAPPDGWSSVEVSPLDAFLTASAGTLAADPAQVIPRRYMSIGDYHPFDRTRWSTDAVQTTFNAGNQWVTDHQNATFGHVSIYRGDDYLLVASGQFDGQSGYEGRPEPLNGASWKANTLFVADGTLDSSGAQYCFTGSEQYIGCQCLFTRTMQPPVAHLETESYTFSKANLGAGYGNNHQVSPLSTYYRTLLNIGGDISFVYERLTAAHLSSTRKLFWHVPSYNATTTLNGNIASNTFGSSTLWIATVFPAAANLNWVQDTTTWGGATVQYTQRLEVADPNGGTNPNGVFLTVLAPVASTAVPAAYSAVDATNMKGAIYDDGAAPRVALFATDGTAQTSVNYVAFYTPGVTARHVILDLKPGAYSVQQEGALLSRAIMVRNDGSLSFTTQGGGRFAVSPTGVPPAGMSGRTTLVGNARVH